MFFSDCDPALKADLSLRRARLCELMRAREIDALLICTGVNLYYLTGRMPDGYFYLNAQGDCRLFLRRPTAWQGEGIVPIKHPSQIAPLLDAQGLVSPARLMLEEDVLSYAEYSQLLSCFEGIAPAKNLLRSARMIKTPYEQALLREAGAWHTAAMEGVPSLYRPGMTERDFSVAIEHHFRLRGHLGNFRTYGRRMDIFMGSVLAGDNGGAPSPFDFALGGAGAHPTLPIGSATSPLRAGQTIMVDVSGNINGYLSDMSRTYSVEYAPEAALRAHDASVEIQNAIAAAAIPGTPINALWQLAQDIVAAHGLGKSFMGLSQQARFAGHGLGLEINEPPVITPKDETPLACGMAIAVEPKFVLEGIGPVGVENTYLIGEDGAQRITGGEDRLVVL